MVKECRRVHLYCVEPYRIPYFKRVTRGIELNNCKVVFATPTECILSRSTTIKYIKYCNYNITREDGNVIIDEDCGGKWNYTYIYPEKVYDTVYKLYIEPMTRDEQPFTPGLILVGSPGTGKSTLARIISRIVGVSTFDVSPDTILSKYVGESEKAIRNIIENARKEQPSIIILDDAEWLLSARKLSSMGEDSKVFLNIKNELFNIMQELYNNGERVLFIASTNVKSSEIDRAFLRVGRFGDPLFIPLPDYKAVKRIISKMVPEDKADEIARKVVNMGLSLADAVGMAERVKIGLPYDVKPSSGRGYMRVHVKQVDYSRFLEYYSKDIFKGKARIYLNGNEDLMSSIAIQVSYNSGVSVIKLVDIRYYDEAVHTANMTNSNMIASTSIPKEIILYLMSNLEHTLFLVGKMPPQPGIEVYPLTNMDILLRIIGKKNIVNSLLYYKEINVDDKLVDKLLNTIRDDDKLIKFLEVVASLGYMDEQMISRYSNYIH